jgi:hypothetical protein
LQANTGYNQSKFKSSKFPEEELMSDQTNGIGSLASPTTPTRSRSDLAHQLASLAQQVGELEAALNHCRAALAQTEAERDHFRTEALRFWRQDLLRNRARLQEEDERAIRAGDGQPLEALIGDLDRAMEGS